MSMASAAIAQSITKPAFLIETGGIAGAQFLGAPRGWRLRVGRCDSDETNPDVLPAGNLEYSDFAHYWSTVGISIRDAAALMGIHSSIDDHGGEGDPVWVLCFVLSKIREHYWLRSEKSVIRLDRPCDDGKNVSSLFD